MIASYIFERRNEARALAAQAEMKRALAIEATRAQADWTKPGRWVSGRDLGQFFNVSGRAYRDPKTGAAGVFRGTFYELPANPEWWCPLDVAAAPRIDSPTNIPNVKRGTI